MNAVNPVKRNVRRLLVLILGVILAIGGSQSIPNANKVLATHDNVLIAGNVEPPPDFS